ncbi:MAG TPA: hypothetical protein DHW78_02900 [Ruminococcaceae bacterium]|jgi:sodium pump decarboxylase gamma subunit|nr:hypothetical protein [Oscillospiraceae bacterium]HCM23265.1 hypothetical protein [Oscillospiraceae bacterium]
MGEMSTGQIAIVILTTGLVIVFAVLVLLILIIKLYSTAVHTAQKKRRGTDDIETTVASVSQRHSLPSPEPVSAAPAAANDISPEIVTAICAAVYALYGEETPILSVRRAATRTGSRSAWRQAGAYSNTRPF